MELALFEIDKAITDKRPVDPTPEVIPNDGLLKSWLVGKKKILSSWSVTRLIRSTGRGLITSVSW
jgi:hypothetical protein